MFSRIISFVFALYDNTYANSYKCFETNETLVNYAGSPSYASPATITPLFWRLLISLSNIYKAVLQALPFEYSIR